MNTAYSRLCTGKGIDVLRLLTLHSIALDTEPGALAILKSSKGWESSRRWPPGTILISQPSQGKACSLTTLFLSALNVEPSLS